MQASEVMARKCATCGFRHPADEFFRRERGGLLNRSQSVCDACSPHQMTTGERRSILAIPISAFLWAFVVILASQSGIEEGLFVAIMIASGMIFISPLIFVHEFGHAIAARLAKFTLVEVNVGTGPTITGFRWNGAPIRLRRYFLNGGRTRVVDLWSRHYRVRRAVLLIGGPGANALLCFVLLCATRWAPADAGSTVTLALAAPSGIAVASGMYAILNLVPRRARGEATIASDGAQLLGLIRRRPQEDVNAVRYAQVTSLLEIGRLDEAADLALAGQLDTRFGPWLLTLALNALHRTKGPRVALDCYFARRDDLGTAAAEEDDFTRSGRAWLKSTVAGSALEIDDESSRQIADIYSAEAVEELPDDAPIGAARGAWMAKNGMLEEGVTLLTCANRAIVVSTYKVAICDELAGIWRTLGEETRATCYEILSKYTAARI